MGPGLAAWIVILIAMTLSIADQMQPVQSFASVKPLPGGRAYGTMPVKIGILRLRPLP